MRRLRLPVGLIVVLAGVAVLAGSVFVSSGVHRIAVAPERQIAGADPERGREAILRYGCGSCHSVAGIRQARGRVAPSLTGIAERSYIAGRLPNIPDNMIRWLQNPQAFVPGTAMPNLGVSEGDAADMAAYLYALR
ncbi:hypothetical protein BH24DEI1_BH24DEI1_07430 [soil metagenome]|jgi:cytochrome c2|nr:c-type cytochrome [Deinococcota bacterium]